MPAGARARGREPAIYQGLRDFTRLDAKPSARPVTPEVAGSSPVAPVKSPCKSAYCVVSPDASDRLHECAFEWGRIGLNHYVPWLPGGFFLEQHGQLDAMGLEIDSLELIGYDTETRRFLPLCSPTCHPSRCRTGGRSTATASRSWCRTVRWTRPSPAPGARTGRSRAAGAQPWRRRDRERSLRRRGPLSRLSLLSCPLRRPFRPGSRGDPRESRALSHAVLHLAARPDDSSAVRWYCRATRQGSDEQCGSFHPVD